MGSRIQHKPLRGHSNCNAIGTPSLIGKCHAAGLTDPIAYMKSMELQTDFDPTPLRTLSPEAASRPPTTTSQPAGATSLPANRAASQSASQPPTHQPSQQDTKAACSGADLRSFSMRTSQSIRHSCLAKLLRADVLHSAFVRLRGARSKLDLSSI